MDEKEKKYYLKVLIKEKEKILRNLGFLKDGMENPERGVPTHIGDLGTDEFVKGIDIDISQSEGKILRAIDEAIEKIAKGTYGICENCGNNIPKSRLKVIPYAKYCIECKKEIEKSGEKNP